MKFNEIVIKFIENKFKTVNMIGFKGTRDEFIDKLLEEEKNDKSFTFEDCVFLDKYLTNWRDWMEVLEDFKEYWKEKSGQVPHYPCPYGSSQASELIYDMLIGAVEYVLDEFIPPKDGVTKKYIKQMKSDMAGFVTDDNSIWWYMTNC